MDAAVKHALDAINTIKINPSAHEFDIHALVGVALSNEGIEFKHEARLAPRLRVDFLTSEGVAIEVKQNKPVRSLLLKQIGAYLSCEQVLCIIVVTQKSVRLPDKINNKPVYVSALDRLWGIALP